MSIFFPRHSVFCTTLSLVAFGRSEIIERRLPAILFASVLFPTLGLPTIAIFNASSRSPASSFFSSSGSSTRFSLSIMEQMREKTWFTSICVVSISMTPGAGERKSEVKRSDASLEATSSSIPSFLRLSFLTAFEAVRRRRRSALGAITVVASRPSSTMPICSFWASAIWRRKK